MSSSQVIVVASHDFPFQLYFRGDRYPVVFEPLELVVMHGVEVKVVRIFPLFHRSFVGLLGLGYFLS